VALASRRSAATWADAPGVCAQAAALERRALRLAAENATAWQAVLASLEGAADDGMLEERLAVAAAVPLRLAELAADVAELAVVAAEHCAGTFRGEAATAGVLAEAAARAAELLVGMNLAVTEDDERLQAALVSREAAGAGADRAVAAALGR